MIASIQVQLGVICLREYEKLKIKSGVHSPRKLHEIEDKERKSNKFNCSAVQRGVT